MSTCCNNAGTMKELELRGASVWASRKHMSVCPPTTKAGGIVASKRLDITESSH